jgi:hypothetical protein
MSVRRDVGEALSVVGCKSTASPLSSSTGKIVVCELMVLSLLVFTRLLFVMSSYIVCRFKVVVLVAVRAVWLADGGWAVCVSVTNVGWCVCLLVADGVSVGDVWLLCAFVKCLVKLSSRVNTFPHDVQGCLCRPCAESWCLDK